VRGFKNLSIVAMQLEGFESPAAGAYSSITNKLKNIIRREKTKKKKS